MNREHFLIRSKSSSTSWRFATTLLLISLFFGCGPRVVARPAGPAIERGSQPVVQPTNSNIGSEAIDPPWQLWSGDTFGNPDLVAAEAAVQAGRYQEAIDRFKAAEDGATSAQIREEAFNRRMGSTLRLGNSRQVLEDVTRFLRAQGRTIEDASPVVGLLVAFSYLHLGDNDQTFAWLSLVHRRVNGQGIFARRAVSTATRLARTVSAASFSAANDRWTADKVIGPVFAAERARRAQGGVAEPGLFSSWFVVGGRGDAFGLGAIGETDITAGDLSGSANSNVVGVLLPLTGKFAEHAVRVKQGIELALKEFLEKEPGSGLRLVVADTRGEADVAGQEYERLVRQEGAAVVLGPLLVKTAEEVARRSDSLGIPFVTFTKRPNITELSRVAFRLGATAGDQVSELLNYSQSELAAKRIAILYPRDVNGQEFATVLRERLREGSLELVNEGSYTPGSRDSMAQAVSAAANSSADVIFVPDSLENVQPIFDAVKKSALSKAVLIGPALWDDPVAVRGFGQLLDGAAYVTPFFAQSPRPMVSRFVTNYRGAFHKDPELLAAQGYDAAQFVFRSMVGSPESRETLIERLRRADTFEGVTGQLTVQPNGELSRRMSVLRLSNGDIVEVMSAGAVTGFLPRSASPEEAGAPDADATAGH